MIIDLILGTSFVIIYKHYPYQLELAESLKEWILRVLATLYVYIRKFLIVGEHKSYVYKCFLFLLFICEYSEYTENELD